MPLTAAVPLCLQVRAGPGWNETAILFTWDDPGGTYPRGLTHTFSARTSQCVCVHSALPMPL